MASNDVLYKMESAVMLKYITIIQEPISHPRLLLRMKNCDRLLADESTDYLMEEVFDSDDTKDRVK